MKNVEIHASEVATVLPVRANLTLEVKQRDLVSGD